MIAGTVWLDANGNGERDEGEQPLVDVAITLEDEAGVVLRSTQSMGSGMYLFMDLFPGSYVVRASNLSGSGYMTPSAVGIDLEPGAVIVLDFGYRSGWFVFLPMQLKVGLAP
jgi:hypothetical protein